MSSARRNTTLTQKAPSGTFQFAPKANFVHSTQAAAEIRHKLGGVGRGWQVHVVITAIDAWKAVGQSHRLELGFRCHESV